MNYFIKIKQADNKAELESLRTKLRLHSRLRRMGSGHTTYASELLEGACYIALDQGKLDVARQLFIDMVHEENAFNLLTVSNGEKRKKKGKK